MERRQASLEDSLLVTVERAAELLGVGRTFVYRLINSGDLPSVKMGRSRRIVRAALDEYVKGLSRG